MPLTRRPDRLDEQEKRKRNLLIIAGILILLVVATVFEVGIRAPQIPFASNLIVFFLFNLNLIVFLLLLVLLFRNLVKLSFERRHKVIGSRFKAKLVLTFLALALVPGILIFLIASNFITTSIEGWFKPQVERPLDQAMEVAQTYYQGLEAHRPPPRALHGQGDRARRAARREQARGPRRLPDRAAGAARGRRDHRLQPRGAGAGPRQEPGPRPRSRPARPTASTCSRRSAARRSPPSTSSTTAT